MDKWDEELRDYLFTSGSILELEEGNRKYSLAHRHCQLGT